MEPISLPPAAEPMETGAAADGAGVKDRVRCSMGSAPLGGDGVGWGCYSIPRLDGFHLLGVEIVLGAGRGGGNDDFAGL